MKLSESTFNILKNYSSINQTLLVKPGNVISTVVPVSRAIFAKCTVEETFPKQFAIYELPKFLGILSLFKEPELDFGDKQVTIVSGRQSVSYTYADPSMVIAPRGDDINFPEADVEFSISQEELQKLVRAAGVLQLPDMAVTGDGSTIKVTATDSKNPTADVFSVEVGETDKMFTMYFRVDNIIKLISHNYNVKITFKGLSKWTSDNIVYYVAMEANSSVSG